MNANERYIVFDVETPNAANSRMSALGIAVVENGRIVRTWETLVNPECHFDPFNVQLTGITPGMAAEAPSFPELWPVLEPVFSSGLLVAHNAPFDMRVLGACLRAYGISWRRQTAYACTCQMSRACFPGLENHRLNTLCAYLGIELDHHRAGSDTTACARLLQCCLEAGADIRRFRRTYDFALMRTLRAG